MARGIAHWVVHRPKLLPVIEVGAGDGSLARDIIAAIPLLQRWRIDYHIVETSQPLREKQRENAPRSTTWHDDMASALRTCGGRALMFSNELVDAYPPRLFRREPEGWAELFLHRDNAGVITESWQKVAEVELPTSTVFSQKHPVGQRVEVHQSYHADLKAAAAAWSEGELLTIDYGDRIDSLYHRRPAGSMRAYLLHQLIDGAGIYQNIGRQDLTCDVNFSDLIAWGQALGWQIIDYQMQAEFLAPHARGTTVDAYLLHPDGPGSAFKVLTQKITSRTGSDS